MQIIVYSTTFWIALLKILLYNWTWVNGVSSILCVSLLDVILKFYLLLSGCSTFLCLSVHILASTSYLFLPLPLLSSIPTLPFFSPFVSFLAFATHVLSSCPANGNSTTCPLKGSYFPGRIQFVLATYMHINHSEGFLYKNLTFGPIGAIFLSAIVGLLRATKQPARWLKRWGKCFLF